MAGRSGDSAAVGTWERYAALAFGGCFAGAEGETSGDRGELIAGTDARRGEARLEDAADGGNEAGSSGEEDAVYQFGRKSCCLQQAVDALLYGCEIFADPGFKVGAGDTCLDIHAAVAEMKLG